ncbi:uncharacterized protein LOC107648801 isoform X1 [Arachis ipaensis]|uniref:uncharacterized protein LOC107648801 isoform X1 n=1 Tax=Arachis ipaensis TaxID=130454 RepID=UPI0007AF66A6|nr:uncharacterized protein LOC107648801 isoform X1 [Arachis ipaensis]QHN86284.1 Remorin [Arachis hypogaea]
MLPWQGTKQSIRDRIGNNVDVYGYGNKRCVCCFFPAVHPAPVQPPPDLLNAVLARVATEKRVSLVKAWEESERSKAENKICGKEEKTVDMQYYSVYEQEQCGSRHTYNTCLQPAQ